MTSITFVEEGVKTTLPRELYQAIVKVQASENLDFGDACIRAAELVNSNTDVFKKAVQKEARRLNNSELMTQLNLSRETIRKKAWEEGANHVRRNEDNFRVPCPKCGKNMRFSSTGENWGKEKAVLYPAFSTWSHLKC